MRFLIAANVAVVFSGCAAPPPQADPESPVAADRLLALRAREWSASPADLAALIEQLDSSDPAVRMLAADSLTDLTGEDHGFRYDDPAAHRSAAVTRWVAWLRKRTDALAGTEGTHGDGEPSSDG